MMEDTEGLMKLPRAGLIKTFVSLLLFFLTQFFYQAICTQSTPKERGRVIVDFMNMGYESSTARTRTRNLFRLKCAPIPLGYSDGHSYFNTLQLLS